MHPIASGLRGANGLTAGDLDRDGELDFLTNYEFDQRYMLALHPPAGQDPRGLWAAATAFKPPLLPGFGVNPENSTLGDVDGDGFLDVIGAQGFSSNSLWEGSQPGIRVIFGPPPARIGFEAAWRDAGRVPATVDRGHFHFVRTLDVNRDGALDIVAGGRVHAGNGRKAGIVWIEAPANALSRDLGAWTLHDIDPTQTGGHGFELTDVDEDGDPDLVLANADFDTPAEQEGIFWYENPGPGPAQGVPWPRHDIYLGSEFHTKPGIAVGDLEQDGHADLLVQVRDAIYWFRKTSVAPASFERVIIPKSPRTRWIGRPIKVADLDRDGRPEIVGMLVHEGNNLPPDKAAAFWMAYRGPSPAADNWTTHTIKWGSGVLMTLPDFGEKWDQLLIEDVDRDGDPDLVANCEEWWVDKVQWRPFWVPSEKAQSVAVVWFENRLGDPPARFGEQGGRVVIEAEHYTDIGDGSWITRATFPGHGGPGYLADMHALLGSRAWADSVGARYGLRLAGGRYAVWLRRWVPSSWGLVRGKTASNSLWLGLDGLQPADFLDNGSGWDRWIWVRANDVYSLPPGDHLLELRVRQGGYAVDRIVLTRDLSWQPSEVGPAETPLP
jgi:hypothetical protein